MSRHRDGQDDVDELLRGQTAVDRRHLSPALQEALELCVMGLKYAAALNSTPDSMIGSISPERQRTIAGPTAPESRASPFRKSADPS